jgi:hypothetical protein
MEGIMPQPYNLNQRRAFLAVVCLLGVATGVSAQTVAPEPQQWVVKPDFAKKPDARKQISGAACVPTTPALRSCLAVNDEKKYAQFFSIDGNTLVPGAFIRLRGEKEPGDPDAEGVAYGGGYFYVIGSHGRSRHGDEDNDSSYNVFRFKVDPATGKTPFKPSDDDVVGVDPSGKLRDLIAGTAPLDKFFNKPLKDGGLNIEGLAVENGRMFIGFRGPSIDKSAYIMSVDAEAVFKGPLPVSKVDPLPLGENVGIRDLAAVDGGLLVLAGPMREEDVPYSILLWDTNSRTIKKKFGVLGSASIPKGAKAETLLVLETGPNHYRVLVMFDGAKNGGPISFRLER